MPAHHTPVHRTPLPVVPIGVVTSPGHDAVRLAQAVVPPLDRPHSMAAEPPGATRPRGRPTLDGRRGSSPRVAFRVPGEVKLALQRLARDTGRRESDLAREALERFLAAGP